jgi:O-antigen ligase
MGLMLFEKRKHVRWVLALLVLNCADAALLSGSRTILAALIPGLIVLAFLLKQRRKMVVRAVIILLVVVAGFTYLLPSAVSQFSDRLGDVGLVDYGRLVVAAEAWIEIAQKPILGWGVNHFAEAGLMQLPGMGEPQGAHVTLLQYWYGAGLLGAAGFLALFAIPVRRMVQVLRKKVPENSTDAVRLILACYTSFFVIFSLGPFVYNRYLYIPMFAFAGFTARVANSMGPRVTARQEAGEHAGPLFAPKQVGVKPEVA